MDTPTSETIPPSTTPQPEQPIKHHSRGRLMLLGLFGILLLLFIGIGMYVFSTQNTQKTPVALQVTPSVQPTVVEEITEEWQGYRLETVGISFRLPPQISNKGEWKEEKIEGETGTVVCFHLPQGSTGFIPKAYAGGIGICNEQVGIPFVMGGSSADFSAGREGVVTDLQGFVKRNDRYYVRFGKSEIEVTVPVKEYVHENGVEILKIYGSKTNGPTIWPNEGWIWAIINTKDDVYRGISLSTSLHVVDEETLDHLLSTITHSQ